MTTEATGKGTKTYANSSKWKYVFEAKLKATPLQSFQIQSLVIWPLCVLLDAPLQVALGCVQITQRYKNAVQVPTAHVYIVSYIRTDTQFIVLV